MKVFFKMPLFTGQNSYPLLYQIPPKNSWKFNSIIVLFQHLIHWKIQIFHREIFLQIWYDVQVGLYFFFEKVDIIPIIPNIYCYYVQTKKSKVMKSSSRNFSHLQCSKSYQKTSFKDYATILVLYNFSP